MSIPPPSKRMFFRPFNENDFSLVYQLNSDSRVMEFLGGVRDEEGTFRDLQRYIGYSSQYPGYGYWCASMKKNRRFVGLFAVKVLLETGETEIGYRLLPEFWDRGLATEGAMSMKEYCFQKLKVDRIVGLAIPGNVASRNVLEKIGMRFKTIGAYYNNQCAYYFLDRTHG